jgi:hypothetical protein
MFLAHFPEVKASLQESWFMVLFKYTALANLIEKPENPDPLTFYNTYFSSWWLTRLWFRSCILRWDVFNEFLGLLECRQILEQSSMLNWFNQVANHKESFWLCSVIDILQKNYLLNTRSIELIINHPEPFELKNVLSNLEQQGILNQDNFTVVAQHPKPYRLACALRYLQAAKILNSENRAVVAANKDNPEEYARALPFLQRVDILNQDSRALLVNHPNISNFSDTVNYLYQARILNQDSLALLAKHSNISNFSDTVNYLYQARILNQDNLAAVAKHADPYSLGRAIFSLGHGLEYGIGILNQQIFDAVAKHADPYSLGRAIVNLSRGRILYRENFNFVCETPNLRTLSSALFCLNQARILNQDSFNEIISPRRASLLSAEAGEIIWGRIPGQFLTQRHFRRILTAATNTNPMNELTNIRDEILGIPANHHRTPMLNNGQSTPVLNNGQSTHTASVHRSVSDSAKKLLSNYGSNLDVDTKIHEILTFVNNLDNSSKHQVAKRCIKRITQINDNFTDSSGVSTRQLLALFYTAIHDDTKRLGTLHDAKNLFVEGLYEIQRGYNLNEQGQDLGGEDNIICAAGTFNKLMEKLNGIHQDVFIYYITHAGALFKFPILSKECALNYLNSLASPKTAENDGKIKDLLEQLKNERSLEPIWKNIKSAVVKSLWNEFSEAYSNNQKNPDYLNLIDTGIYVSLTELDLSTFEKSLEASLGCKADLNNQKPHNEISQHSIFSEEMPIEEVSPQSDIQNLV